MMTRLGLVFCAALLAGCEAISVQTLPEGVTEADVALFKTTVTDAGCAIDRTTAPQVKAQTGFVDDKLTIIVQYLTLAGESEPTATGFRLTSGTCSNA